MNLEIKIKGIRFNKQEFAGSFGDIGTDLPLIIAMITAAGLHAPSVLIVFGLMQISTGLIYKIPMPVQPLKAMATLVIAQQIGGNILLGAGLSIGIVMFLLSISGLLGKISMIIPKAVIRGLQLGLGLSLCLLAFKKYIPNDGFYGYVIAILSFILILIFIDSKKYPASLIVVSLGLVYALIFKVNLSSLIDSFGVNLPVFSMPNVDDISKGFILLALPQIPLSIGNSIIATKQVSEDLFPEKKNITIKKIGLTYSFMNLIIPFVSGIPSCHGSGGIAGHYAFGGRTGGSVVIYGFMYVILGLFFGNNFAKVIQVFPLPVLGVVLVFEGLALMSLIKDQLNEKKNLIISLLVGVIAAGMPFGFVTSMVIGSILYYIPVKLWMLDKK
jgi:hypothetical protein